MSNRTKKLKVEITLSLFFFLSKNALKKAPQNEMLFVYSSFSKDTTVNWRFEAPL